MSSRTKFKWLILFLLAVLFEKTTAQEKNWTSVNYGPKQYGRNYEAANYSLAQDSRGVMYFGSATGVQEFDGYFWQFIPVKPGLWISALATDKKGQVFIGAQNEFGYLKSDSIGKFRYFSLSDSIKNKVFPFSTIWKIYHINELTYFQSEEYIFIYDGKNINIIDAKTSFHTSFLVNGKYYVRQRSIGLMEFNNNDLQLVNGGSAFKEIGIFSICPIPKRNGQFIIATQEDGLWLMDEKGISRINDSIGKLVTSLHLKILGCSFNSDQELVFNTSNEGIVFATMDGQLLDHMSQLNGLPDNCINNLLIDSEKSIWVTSPKGISRIDNNPSFSFFSQKEGITGSINKIIRFNSNLYIGTSAHLLTINDDSKRFAGNEFIPIVGMDKQIWDFANCDGHLVVAANDGLYLIDKGHSTKISDKPTRSLSYLSESKLLLAGGSKGLFIYSINGWQILKNIAENIDVVGLAVDTSSNKEVIIWLGSYQQGLSEISLTNDLETKIDQYTENDGLNPGLVWPFKWENKILFLSNQLVFTHISEEEIKKGLPDSIKNDPKYNRGYFDAFQFPYKKPIYSFIESNDRTWITDGNQVGFVMKNDSIFVSKPFNGIDFGKINCIYPENSGITWIGANDGLIRYDCSTKTYNDSVFSCIIRKIRVSEDSVLYYGGPIIPINPSLNFNSNNIKIEFSSSNYYNGTKTHYSYYLEGYMNKWSEWIPDHYANFINLHEGEYTFKVKAKNVYGTESSEATYRFRILAPWYRTWIAYLFYAAVIIMMIWLIIKFYTYRLKQKNKHLEEVVKERTKEIMLQKDKIEEQNIDLEKRNIEIMQQKADITDSINYAKQIQTALLPKTQIAKKYVNDIFILFKPRDIVSGDFYWISEVNDLLIVVAADCTGHGVPGAFMSMLGMSFLNSIVNEKNITDPGSVLNNLRNYIINSLHQRASDSHSKDGMDICFCLIDKPNSCVYYAGAYNPLIHVSNNEVFELKTDRFPVAVFLNDSSFTTRQITVKEGDMLYLFSDGYSDQFGGPQNNKFMKKNFKEKLLEISNEPLCNQEQLLDHTIENFRGCNQQTDDILVIGIKV
jgi:serine phosphatase RsbU (regulator of sigma subunit)/ligand-binding sensor domain-containing protein